jgi:hypothetical protein
MTGRALGASDFDLTVEQPVLLLPQIRHHVSASPRPSSLQDQGGYRLGYARVSTYGPTLHAQLEQLSGAGCTKIYREKVTGAHSDRRELLKMLHRLAPGDVVNDL